MEKEGKEFLEYLHNMGISKEEIEKISGLLEESEKVLERTVQENTPKWMAKEDAEKEKEFLKKKFYRTVYEKAIEVDDPQKIVRSFPRIVKELPDDAQKVWEYRQEEIITQRMVPVRLRGDIATSQGIAIEKGRRMWIEGSPMNPRKEELYADSMKDLLPRPGLKGGAFKGSVGSAINEMLEKRKKKRKK